MAEVSPAGLQKLTPLSLRWLAEVGVRSRADLVQMGPMAAYRLIQATQKKANLRLLYALQAALDNLHWTALPGETKERLRREAEAAGP
jgi:hypothetical protein